MQQQAATPRIWSTLWTVVKTLMKDLQFSNKLLFTRLWSATKPIQTKPKLWKLFSNKMLILTSLTQMDGQHCTMQLTSETLSQLDNFSKEKQTLMPFQTSTRRQFTSLLWTTMHTSCKYSLSNMETSRPETSTSAHHCILLARREARSAFSCCSKTEQTSWLKTIDPGHLYTMLATMDTTRQLTSYWSGRQTTTSSEMLRIPRARLLSS